jgi:hypothetical protein
MSGRRREHRNHLSEMIERRYRPPGTSLSRAEVKAASVRGDRDALRRISEERGGLEGEHDVRFGLDLPGPALAGEVATTLRDEGYAVTVERSDGRALVVAAIRFEPTEDALRAHTERFCALADAYAARYRGFAL